MKLIQSAWLSYRDSVMPQGAPATQVMVVRRAFYAGSLAFLTEIIQALAPGSEATDGDIGVLTSIQAELDEFCQQVRDGIA